MFIHTCNILPCAHKLLYTHTHTLHAFMSCCQLRPHIHAPNQSIATSHAHTHTLSLSLNHTHARTRTRTHTHTHTRTHATQKKKLRHKKIIQGWWHMMHTDADRALDRTILQRILRSPYCLFFFCVICLLKSVRVLFSHEREQLLPL
jgi:hypothetical protein